ncbi:hypothetical protein BVRB_1g017640 [Beta vulgaris subsp. vulgaris]|nr:hypothetical protein BVRB_1g017640 [Beta vulgaris subsp. vulgaris]
MVGEVFKVFEHGFKSLGVCLHFKMSNTKVLYKYEPIPSC